MASKKTSSAKTAPAKPGSVKLPKGDFPVRPRGDRVIVKMSTGIGTTPGGIVLPDSAQEKSQVVTIVAVGPGRRDKDGVLIPMELEVGQRVLAHTYAGSPIAENRDLGIGADQFQIMREDDIIAVL